LRDFSSADEKFLDFLGNFKKTGIDILRWISLIESATDCGYAVLRPPEEKNHIRSGESCLRVFLFGELFGGELG
jgi:uncharacterized protein YehS (DUF1456 family)